MDSDEVTIVAVVFALALLAALFILSGAVDLNTPGISHG